MIQPEALIQLRGVSKDYPLGKVTVPALRGVDLSVSSGEFTALTGPSGSGKTTLLNLAGCIDKPSDGTVWIDGQDTTPVALHQLAPFRARRLGFVFQTFNLFPVLTAFENVEYPLLLSGLGKKERREKVSHWLAEVGLADRSGQKPDQLSGGQRQRVAIARAMIAEPALVLADEPTASLDSHTAAGILDLLERLNLGTGTTFLFATHDPRVMERARRQVSLRDGAIEDDSRASLRHAGGYAHAV